LFLVIVILHFSIRKQPGARQLNLLPGTGFDIPQSGMEKHNASGQPDQTGLQALIWLLSLKQELEILPVQSSTKPLIALRQPRRIRIADTKKGIFHLKDTLAIHNSRSTFSLSQTADSRFVQSRTDGEIPIHRYHGI
jgi:hypothetical protein